MRLGLPTPRSGKGHLRTAEQPLLLAARSTHLHGYDGDGAGMGLRTPGGRPGSWGLAESLQFLLLGETEAAVSFIFVN